MRKNFMFLLLCFLLVRSTTAQDTIAIHEHAPKLYIDCQAGCDMTYLQNELPYINFVRDMRLCDVYMMITSVTTGAGGRQFTLLTTDEKKQTTDTLKWSLPPNSPDASIREQLKKNIKLALLPFIAATLAEFVDYDVPMPKKTNELPKKDKWNSWIFNLGANGYGGGNSYNLNINTGGWISAGRVTAKSKFDFVCTGNYSFTSFEAGTTKATAERSGFGFFNRKVWSIGEHFAAGWFASYTSSSVNNLKTNATIYPAFEWNLFPYKVASHKMCRIIYRAGARYQNYMEETVFDNKERILYPHSLVLDLTIIEKWGTIDVALGGTHYFNMTNYYNGTVSPSVTLNLFKGFRLSLFGSYSLVNDQFFLRKAAASNSQILLGQTALKTNYSFSSGLNISYSFGSMYNNTVNVRFDLDRNLW